MPLVDVINDPDSDVALLWLITVTDTASSTVLRGVANLEDVVSRGETYTAFPFSVALPTDDGDRPQNLTLIADNVSHQLIQVLRETEKPPKVKLELVLSNDLDTVEKLLDFFEVAAVTYNEQTIEFDLSSTFIFARRTVTGSFNQFEFPALFWAMGSQ